MFDESAPQYQCESQLACEGTTSYSMLSCNLSELDKTLSSLSRLTTQEAIDDYCCLIRTSYTNEFGCSKISINKQNTQGAIDDDCRASSITSSNATVAIFGDNQSNETNAAFGKNPFNTTKVFGDNTTYVNTFNYTFN